MRNHVWLHVTHTFPARQHCRSYFRDFRAFFEAPCLNEVELGQVDMRSGGDGRVRGYDGGAPRCSGGCR